MRPAYSFCFTPLIHCGSIIVGQASLQSLVVLLLVTPLVEIGRSGTREDIGHIGSAHPIFFLVPGAAQVHFLSAFVFVVSSGSSAFFWLFRCSLVVLHWGTCESKAFLRFTAREFSSENLVFLSLLSLIFRVQLHSLPSSSARLSSFLPHHGLSDVLSAGARIEGAKGNRV